MSYRACKAGAPPGLSYTPIRGSFLILEGFRFLVTRYVRNLYLPFFLFHFLVTFRLLPSGTPRSAYSSSSRSPAGLDKTARTSYPPRHAVRGMSNNPYRAAVVSQSLHLRH